MPLQCTQLIIDKCINPDTKIKRIWNKRCKWKNRKSHSRVSESRNWSYVCRPASILESETFYLSWYKMSL